MDKVNSDSPKLVRKDIDALDAQIDQQIPVNRLKKLPKKQSIISLLTMHEINYFIELPQELFDRGATHQGIVSTQRMRQESLGFCIDWLYKFCRGDRAFQDNKDFRELFKTLAPIYDFSLNYLDAWVVTTALYKGRLVASQIDCNTFEVRFPRAEQIREDYSNKVIAEGEMEYLKEPEAVALIAEWDDRLIHQLANMQRAADKLVLPQEHLPNLIQSSLNWIQSHWEFDPEWDFGGFKVQELQRFWAVLYTLTQLHSSTVMAILRRHQNLNWISQVIQNKSRRNWINQISSLSNLAADTTEAILNHLTYFGPETGCDASCQPFFALDKSTLALSNTTALTSNTERNSWYLLSRQNKKIHGKYSDSKETLWRSQLTEFLTPLKYKAFGPFPYKSHETEGDLDLLIVSESERFALVCELKWLMLPASISQETFAKERMEIGRKQALSAFKWLKANLDCVAGRINLEAQEFETYEFKPIMICRSMLDSAVSEFDVPTINENLLKWILDRPLHKSLRELWEIASTRSYMAKEHVHFRIKSDDIACGKVTIKCINTVAEKLKAWTPERDISPSR